MIICNSRKFIFVHIHKCAGSSINFVLEPLMQWNDILCGATEYGEVMNGLYQSKFGIDKHSPAFQIRKIVSPQIWDDYFTFTFVRNPYSRVVSLYTYIDKLLKQYRHRYYLKSGLNRLRGDTTANTPLDWPLTQAYLGSRSFSEFIRHPKFREDPATNSQLYWLRDEMKGEIIVDFLGKVENLRDDFARIQSRIQAPDTVMQAFNVSSRSGQWEQYYQPDDYELIRELYAEDFEYLGYDAAQGISSRDLLESK